MVSVKAKRKLRKLSNKIHMNKRGEMRIANLGQNSGKRMRVDCSCRRRRHTKRINKWLKGHRCSAQGMICGGH